MPRLPLLAIVLLWPVVATGQIQPANGNGLQFAWKGRHSPIGRLGHQMVYFPPQRRTLLFSGGGGGFGGDLAHLFWDGVEWTEQLPPEVSPPARWAYSMAYDANRKVVVLFGGFSFPSSSETFTDTWEWDGQTWELRATTGPSRAGSMVFDSNRGVMVLQAFTIDLNGDSLGETWEWDGVSWTLRHSGGPLPSFPSGAAFDSARGVTVLWGGRDAQGLAFETWEWDGSDWSLRSSTGPSPRMQTALAYDSERGVTVLFAGIEGDSSQFSVNDTWEWDGIEWRERQIPGPPRRWLHAMTYDSDRGVLIMQGGAAQPNSASDQTWEYDGQAWTNLTPTTPGPLHRHALAFDSGRGQTVLFGGNRIDSRLPDEADLSGQTWEWDGLQWRLRAEIGPGPRQWPAMAYDHHRGVTIMGGGSTVQNGEWVRLFDTWEWDGESWLQRGTVGPDFGGRPLMAYDSARRVTVLLGGTGVWEWDGQSWNVKLTWQFPLFSDNALAYDPRREAVVRFTGSGFGSSLSQWDGSGWIHLASSAITVFGPESFAMSFDRRRRALVAYGPIDFGTRSDYLWEWDGPDLIPSVLGPTTRWDHAMVYDSLRDVLVVYGGVTPNESPFIRQQLWEYSLVPPTATGIGFSLHQTVGPRK